jgi:hypothetical protein
MVARARRRVMRLGALLMLAGSVMIATLPLVHASGRCDCNGGACLGTVTIGSGRANDPVPTFYVDDRNYAQGNGVWIYMESNGIDGLQRGGASPFVPNDNEICWEDSIDPPDTLIF